MKPSDSEIDEFYRAQIEHLKGYRAMYSFLYQVTEFPEYDELASSFGEAVKLVEDFAQYEAGEQ